MCSGRSGRAYGGWLICRMGRWIGCHGYHCCWTVCGRRQARSEYTLQLYGAASKFKIHLNDEIMAKQTEKVSVGLIKVSVDVTLVDVNTKGS